MKSYFHTTLSYMTIERLQGEPPFENALFACQNTFEKSDTKAEPAVAKAISTSNTLDCSCQYPCTLSHSYAW